MFPLLMLLCIVGNVYYALQPDALLPPWAHVLGAIFCFWALISSADDY
jgi:Na+/H+ antiporter NhaD/arsenite permease-like protein